MEARPIPAFYCCYLLRSRPSPAFLYVGSTPNPPRRLKQHNGKGGAVRTRRENHRPWEMSCIVTGFPSKIAALQFEWAWHNTHLTKRIAAEERITKVPPPKKGRNGKKKVPRPKETLKDKLQNLHLLLRVPSFARWPLNVRFFYEEVWQKWQHESAQVSGIIRSGINIVLDIKRAGDVAKLSEGPLSTHEKGKRRRDAISKGGVDGIDVGYGGIKGHLEKGISVFRGDQVIECAVCTEGITGSREMIIVCPSGTCSATSHMTCLATKFLNEEEAHEALLPTSGHCPKCNISTQWIDLVKEMSLRARGEKDVLQLTKKPTTKKIKAAKASESATIGIEPDAMDEEDADDVPDDPLPDDWLPREDNGDDMISVGSAASEAPGQIKPSNKRVRSVIEDSEWDEAEVLD